MTGSRPKNLSEKEIGKFRPSIEGLCFFSNSKHKSSRHGCLALCVCVGFGQVNMTTHRLPTINSRTLWPTFYVLSVSPRGALSLTLGQKLVQKPTFQNVLERNRKKWIRSMFWRSKMYCTMFNLANFCTKINQYVPVFVFLKQQKEFFLSKSNVFLKNVILWKLIITKLVDSCKIVKHFFHRNVDDFNFFFLFRQLACSLPT